MLKRVCLVAFLMLMSAIMSSLITVVAMHLAAMIPNPDKAYFSGFYDGLGGQVDNRYEFWASERFSYLIGVKLGEKASLHNLRDKRETRNL